MTDVRVYIPVSPQAFREFADGAPLGPAPLRGFAVGEAIRRAYGEDDDELWEFGAQQEAAAAAAVAGAVLVVAADVPGASVATPDPTSAEVSIGQEVPARCLRAVLVGDDILTGAEVAAGEEEIELSWFDPSEVSVVVHELDC